MKPELSIVIPVYNEEELIVDSIKKVSSLMQKSKLRYELILVDDGSKDASLELMKKFASKKKNIRVVRHKKNRGYSETIRTGLRQTKGKYSSHLDADLQYDPKGLIRLYRCANKLQISFISGDMYKTTNKSTYPFYRKILSIGRNMLTCLLFSIPQNTDVNNIKLIKTSLLRKINFSKRAEVVGLELITGSQRDGCQVFSLPVKVKSRSKGASSFYLGLIFQNFINIVSLWLERKQRKPKICVSFDVEEYRVPERNNVKSSFNKNTELSKIGLSRLLNLFKTKNVLSTFFVTGYYAEREPESVKAAQNQGHEIGCHSYHDVHHGKFTPKQIKDQISLATSILKRLCGRKPKGFRAPQFSINSLVRDQIMEEGYLYDSSVHPAIVPGRCVDFKTSLFPFVFEKNGKYLAIFPCSVMPLIRFPISGWWMRNIGLWLTTFGTQINLKLGRDVILYFHPWEFADLPRIKGIPKSMTRGTGLNYVKKLEKFIDYFQKKGYEFTTIEKLLK